MNKILLRNSIEVLKSVHLELHSSVKDKEVLDTLVKIIKDLELACKDSTTNISVNDVLKALGEVVKNLPSVIKAVETISKLINN